MRHWSILLAGVAVCLGACLALVLGVSRVRALEADAAHAGNGTLPQSPHHRQQFPPFSDVFRINADKDIGRCQLILDAFIPSGETFFQFGFTASEEDVMDLRTLTHHGFASRGFLIFIHDFEGGGPDTASRRKAIYQLTDVEGSQSIHFDPPLRIRQGDLLFFNAFTDSSSGARWRSFILHGSVPASFGADTFHIE